MKDLNNYLIPSEEDINWGLYINVVGKATVEAGQAYPDPQHPTGYFFKWEKGRVLHEYQILYIVEGEGIFENKESTYEVQKGNIIFLRPGEWHRYQPNKKTGWTEYYIGFNGDWMGNVIKQETFQNTQLISTSASGQITSLFHDLFDIVKEERLGYQKIGCGIILQIIGHVVQLSKKRNDLGQGEKLVEQAKIKMQEALYTEVDFQEFCDENNISYSYFRKAFKELTGLAPLQYHLNLKIIKAKELLVGHQKKVKEVAFELGFNSVYYFSRLFKQKTGVSPKEYRS
ncbi:AraC family transcriptional regulator [Flammeovirga yaeyamensis]|uniref:AraC family transcriptional regulator n=1 Tax=Flammeovirga yaeyamensis TaxID=367791 RepID=A0AAX1NCD1_9BACT|nr:AraC family transcriptional regulator [Flammeovirga yaeyamensis]MBB3697202.1 AraC-like DNA-binding protein [Flammeovirga yaeyamensis]NMF33863.1 AraC family transcriptional regulator [Flammeovirga yaeyamensis]QWG04877.1 AraC family transcriptional regulator [Flammeovirga yaeyamensis]